MRINHTNFYLGSGPTYLAPMENFQVGPERSPLWATKETVFFVRTFWRTGPTL